MELRWLQVKEKCDQCFTSVACASPKTFHITQHHTMHKTNLDSHQNFSPLRQDQKEIDDNEPKRKHNQPHELYSRDTNKLYIANKDMQHQRLNIEYEDIYAKCNKYAIIHATT